MGWRPIEISAEDRATFERAFARKARFQTDEHIDPAVVELLRSNGFNVRTAADAGLAGHADEDYLTAAHRDDRILLTSDEGFLNDRTHPPHRNPGVVVLPSPSGGFQPLADALRALLQIVAPYREIVRGSKVKIASNGEISVWGYEAELGRRTKHRYRLPGGGRPPLQWVEEPLA